MAIVLAVLRLLSFVIIADAILSWVQRPSQTPRKQLGQITGPVYAPVRALIPPEKLGGIDISPLILLVGLNMLANFLVRL